MKSVTYQAYGSPDVLRLEELPIPTPGDNQVLVNVKAVSINSWDWDSLTGKPYEYRLISGLFKPRSRQLRGCDVAGTVVQVGPNVTDFAVGDDVFGDLADKGWGAFAEYLCADASSLRRKPASMSFEHAACLPHGGNLATQGLIDAGCIKAGQKVLINGGGGSTGTLVIQIARTYDVEITAVDHTDKLEMMRELGADRVIDFTTGDFTRTGQRYDLIFDVKTDRSVFDYRRALADEGVYATVGGSSVRLLQLLCVGRFLSRCALKVVGYQPNKDTDYLMDLYEQGVLKPVIDSCYPLEKTAEAFRHYGTGRFNGKILISPI